MRDIRDQGATIVLVEHVMRAVMAADRPHRRAEPRRGDRRGLRQARSCERPDVMTAYLGARRRMLEARARRQVAYGAAQRAVGRLARRGGLASSSCVVGPNGAGKTHADQRHRRACNRVSAGTHRASTARDSRACRRTASVARASPIVPKAGDSFTGMTVRENLELGSLSAEAEGAAARIARSAVCELLPGAAEQPRRAGRRALGRSAADGRDRARADGAAEALLLDEPSLGLAPLIVIEMFAIDPRAFIAEGMAILLVEQNVALALETPRRVPTCSRKGASSPRSARLPGVARATGAAAGVRSVPTEAVPGGG